MTSAIVADIKERQIPAGEWEIDPVWSALEFEVRKLGLVAIKGRVPGFTGTIVGGDEPSVSGAVNATSITTFDETRDGHLQSPDFFDTQRHPELRFVSTSVEQDGDEVVVHGDLTIRGVTQPVENPVGLVSFTSNDAVAAFMYASNPNITQFTLFETHQTIDDSRCCSSVAARPMTTEDRD